MELEFLEDGHIYRLGEKEIPSVSEIIRFMAREVYGEADKFAMDKAADRGTRVHRAAEEIDRTGKCECDSDISGYVNAYAKFLKEHEVKWEMIEQPVIGLDKLYAGTIDRYGKLDGDDHALVDIKTTKKITNKHKLLYSTQLTLYKWSFAEDDGSPFINIDDDIYTYILKLNEDGTYKLIPAEEKAGLACACLELHKAFEKTKRRKRNG